MALLDAGRITYRIVDLHSLANCVHLSVYNISPQIKGTLIANAARSTFALSPVDSGLQLLL